MSSQYAGRFIFSVFFSLLTIFSQIVAAQDESWKPNYTADAKPETRHSLRFESEVDWSSKLPLPIREFAIKSERAKIRFSTVVTTARFDDAKFRSVGDDFRSTEQRERYGGFKDDDNFSFRPPRRIAAAPDEAETLTVDESFKWMSATKQSLMFLAVQHGYAFTQLKTRESVKGKFWKDYAKSVKSLHGWADGGRFFTNYIAHPMQGAFLGYVQIQNDPKGLKQQFGTSKDYWRSRLKAMAWSAAWSTQFEIGPISQASIGNVGLTGKQTYIDIVVTPTVGTAWLIGEDAVDLFVMKRIERSTDNFYVRIFSRMLFSPTRTIANVFRFKTPWYRDRPTAR